MHSQHNSTVRKLICFFVYCVLDIYIVILCIKCVFLFCFAMKVHSRDCSGGLCRVKVYEILKGITMFEAHRALLHRKLR